MSGSFCFRSDSHPVEAGQGGRWRRQRPRDSHRPSSAHYRHLPRWPSSPARAPGWASGDMSGAQNQGFPRLGPVPPLAHPRASPVLAAAPDPKLSFTSVLPGDTPVGPSTPPPTGRCPASQPRPPQVKCPQWRLHRDYLRRSKLRAPAPSLPHTQVWEGHPSLTLQIRTAACLTFVSVLKCKKHPAVSGAEREEPSALDFVHVGMGEGHIPPLSPFRDLPTTASCASPASLLGR